MFQLKSEWGNDEGMKTTKMANAKKEKVPKPSLIDLVFSWSIRDVLNRNLCKYQVKKIPETFVSTTAYLTSFIAPLILETHTELFSSMTTISQAPVRELLSVDTSKGFKDPDNLVYHVEFKKMGNAENNDGRNYEPAVGDLIALTDVMPKCIDDLNKPNRSYLIAHLQWSSDDKPDIFSILTSKPIFDENDEQKNKQKTLFAVYLINMTTNIRIWNALHQNPEEMNKEVIERVLHPGSPGGEDCAICFSKVKDNGILSEIQDITEKSNLNDSQEAAILSSISLSVCHHRSNVKLIWGPPGTGKTKTVGVLLSALFRLKCRTVACAPTNIAILQVAAQLLRQVTGSLGHGVYGLGDIILYGNAKRMKIEEHDDLLDIFLDYRASVLLYCFSPLMGWRHSLVSMIHLLEDPESQYNRYLLATRENPDEEVDTENPDEEVDGDVEVISRVTKNKGVGRNNNALKKAIFKAVEENNKKQKKKGKGKGPATKVDHKKHNEEAKTAVVPLTIAEFTKAVEENNKKQKKKGKGKGKGKVPATKVDHKKHNEEAKTAVVPLTFAEFTKKSFNALSGRLKFCIENLCTHLPTSLISLEVVNNMASALASIESLESSLLGVNASHECLKKLSKYSEASTASSLSKLSYEKQIVVDILKSLPGTFPVPNFIEVSDVRKFILKKASLFFCTASSSAKLHTCQGEEKLELVVIDEATQLKECESAIPLTLPSIRHAVLIGDERQLPAMVQSKVSDDANFGRSLFERLVLLGYKKHLLNVQYRMHPSISLFPNKEFYEGKIQDGKNVKDGCYQKHFLQGKMYRSYSFINVAQGQESNWRSKKNMVEVAVISDILARLFKECMSKKNKVSIGVISPYKAQVHAIQEKIGETYSNKGDFTVSVRSVDGFQGGEEDIIIISTVRCNGRGLVGFLSNLNRVNVALTRARYCLWILGNDTTLTNSDSIWKKVVTDAKERGCFYNADEDKSLAGAITASLIELGQHDTLLRMDSLLFLNARWKVCFRDDFRESFARIKSLKVREEVFSVLTKLANGWRQSYATKTGFVLEGASSQLLKQYKVNSDIFLLWSVDIVKENSSYVQILMVWDVLPSSSIPKLVKRMEAVFGNFTVDKMNRCKYRCSDGKLDVPMKFEVDVECGDVDDALSKPFSSLSLSDRPESSSSSSWWRRKKS